MKTTSLYASSKEPNSGLFFISMGLMEILKQNYSKVAFFRPIVLEKDSDISFMLDYFGLDMRYEDAFGVTFEDAKDMIALDKKEELISTLLEKFEKLKRDYKFVFCEGLAASFFEPTIDFDINIELAQNFNTPFANVINAKGKSLKEIYENIMIENEELKQIGCSHFASFLNRVDKKTHIEIENMLKEEKLDIFYIEESKELSYLNVQDIIEALNAKPLFADPSGLLKSVKSFRVAASRVENFIEEIKEDELEIIPANRSEIVLAVYAALLSKSYPNISAIVFPLLEKPHLSIQKFIDDFKKLHIPVLSVKYDMCEIVDILKNSKGRIRPNDERKIALAMGLFRKSVDSKRIKEKLKSIKSDIVTPLMFRYRLFELASKNKKRVVLPESEDDRILRASEVILNRDIADIIFLGDEERVKKRYRYLGLELSKAAIINPFKSDLMEKFVKEYYELRKAKGVTLEEAKDRMQNFSYFATMMVYLGYADAMVSGAIHPTADTLRPAFEIIKTKPGIKKASGLFFICLNTKVLVFADCAIQRDPDEEDLAEIAILSAKTAKRFGIEPRVAMLSYSTGDSGSGADVEKVRKATQIAKKKDPNLLIEGPIQYDAAVDPEVAKIKMPNSKVAGRATVFVFPDLDTGNITYKAVQRSSGAIAIGPVVQGLKKPVNDLSRGCRVEDVIDTIAITAIQAGDSE